MSYLSQVEETARQLPQDVMEAGRRVSLAGIGAVAAIGNTTSTVFDSLVEEGRQFQKSATDWMGKTVDDATKTVNDATGDAVTYVRDHVQEFTKTALNRLGIPSRGDLSDLSARVEALTLKVDLLSRKGASNAD